MKQECKLIAIMVGAALLGGCNNSSDSGKDLTPPITPSITSNSHAFVALLPNGNIEAWGDPVYGGDPACDDPFCTAAEKPLTGIIEITATSKAFAAVKRDGSVIAWGNSPYGADLSEVESKLHNVASISATFAYNGGAFAALKQDGSVTVWGDDNWGGNASGKTLTNIKAITSSSSDAGGAFAAIKNDGSVVTWGNITYGGDSGSVAADLNDVESIMSTHGAFAALKKDGSVVTWGDQSYGGDSSRVHGDLINIVKITANSQAFAALSQDGSIVAWGNEDFGGNPNCTSMFCTAASSPLVDINAITSNGNSYGGAFAAIKKDGTVISWGNELNGGDASSIQGELTHVVSIAATNTAFAAVKQDGSVVTWGDPATGGDPTCNNASGINDCSPASGELNRVASIVGNVKAFAAIKLDGSVVSWGAADGGGNPDCSNSQESDQCVQPSSTLSEIIGITPSLGLRGAFAAIKKDNTILAWGNEDSAGKR